jgi:prevent-host-death family protein
VGTAGVRELKNRLSMYLDRVKRGETITVTERGRPVAELIPTGGSKVLPPHLEALVRSGELILKGPIRGFPKPIKARGGVAASKMVVEDRG